MAAAMPDHRARHRNAIPCKSCLAGSVTGELSTARHLAELNRSPFALVVYSAKDGEVGPQAEYKLDGMASVERLVVVAPQGQSRCHSAGRNLDVCLYDRCFIPRASNAVGPYHRANERHRTASGVRVGLAWSSS
jgi:hypothetical protein